MSLNQYAAERRLAILDDLKAGRAPSEGEYDNSLLREAKTLGQPHMGSTRYEPGSIFLEFLFPNPLGTPLVLPVKVKPPERIVFLPVPEWVIENVWQGDVDGSYQFESDALAMLDRFKDLLAPENNPPLFAGRQATGKA